MPKQTDEGDHQVLVIEAIRALKAPNGSSPAALAKHLKDKLIADDIKKVLKAGIESKTFTKIKASYIVTDDPRYEDMAEKVTWEEFGGNTDADAKRVKKGNTITITYIGTLKQSGAEFDKGDLEFLVGGGEVIRGFDLAVLGMAVGDRRVAQIPASFGYGKRGSPPEIPGNADLVFDITLVKIQ
ncbi:UNVERIFIED_CONTAM: hypothetical protein HDU68_009826 [Siphonaria sp. JEL0065]|nr:hypothetical protein HDU68_009826 [Siphonaria sp. JEL0065]